MSEVRQWLSALATVALALTGCSSSQESAPVDPGSSPITVPVTGCGCPALPDTGGESVVVADVAELRAALDRANAGGDLTVWLENGTYRLDDMLWLEGSGVTFRSRSGNRDGVVIRGAGMGGAVTHVFNVAGDDFTVADLTLGWVSQHGVQIHSDADRPHVHNVRFVDTGEQMLKVSYREGDPTSSDQGIVECSLFEYSAGVGPQYYIGGIDAHQAHDWIVRGNVFRSIRSPEEDLAEHAVHFWSDSSGTLVEANQINDCDRGIGFGLGDRGHSGGIIRNNMVRTTRDVGIGLESARQTQVLNNTVLTTGYPFAIEYRFGGTWGGAIVNNLANAEIASRDGGSADRIETNVSSAEESWFRDPTAGDLHLAGAPGSVVDQGAALAAVPTGIDCQPRPRGEGWDIGADES